jgi:hypothetical protein
MDGGGMVEQIVICGVPKSGTKLLNHMFHAALPGWDYTPQERSALRGSKKTITKMPADLFRIDKIKSKNQLIIITCRDPLMVLTSKHRGEDYWVYANFIGKNQPAPIEWYREIIKRQQQGYFIVKYENLVKWPDMIQQEISELFDLEFENRFSEFRKFPIGTDWEYLDIIRPLKERQLSVQDLPHLGRELTICPELLKVRKQLGYEDISLS